MTNIITTDRPLYFAVEKSNAIVISGLVDANGGAVATASIIHSDVDENAFLGKVVGKGNGYNPLPAVGEEVIAGQIYSYNGGLVICRQTHFMTNFAPADTPALFIVYRENQTSVLEWVSGEQVEVGTHRVYNDVEYVCLQEHVTQSEWTPPAVPALWAVYVVTPPTPEWQIGVAYKIGDIVTYQGASYQCRQAHTSIASWTPPVVPALWLPL